MKNWFFLSLANGANHIALDSPCSNDFSDRNAVVKAKPNEMVDFWERIKSPNPTTCEVLAISVLGSSQCICQGHTELTILRKNFHISVSSLSPKSCMGVALILSTIMQVKSKEILSHAHCPSWKTSATVKLASCGLSGPVICSLMEHPFTHLLSQKLRVDLLPTLQYTPFSKTGNPTLIAFQVGEHGRLSGSLAFILCREQYLLRRTFAHSESFAHRRTFAQILLCLLRRTLLRAQVWGKSNTLHHIVGYGHHYRFNQHRSACKRKEFGLPPNQLGDDPIHNEIILIPTRPFVF